MKDFIHQKWPNTASHPRPAQLYFLKKIHKTPMGIRPIVSSINSVTENVAQFLDHYLQPIMKNLPTYLKDTNQLLDKLANIRIQVSHRGCEITIHLHPPMMREYRHAMKPGYYRNNMTHNTHQRIPSDASWN